MATRYALFALEEVSSTQDVAVELASTGPALVVAAAQTSGRGRQGRAWETAPRALAASLAFRPEAWPADTYPRLSLVAALAAHRVLGCSLTVKWPNDLLRDGAKVAGLLAEGRGEVVVIGMGVNLWWPDAPPGVGGLFDQDPGPGVHLSLGERWGTELWERLQRGPVEWGHEEFRSLCGTIGRSIRWKPSGSGTARDVDVSGRLVVDTPDGEVLLTSGEVWEVR